MKAIHNIMTVLEISIKVVLYPKDTEKWKQFTTITIRMYFFYKLFCIPKILKNESNSQRKFCLLYSTFRCFVSQRYWKMKAIHNAPINNLILSPVVLYPKDTEKWKQFTTTIVAFCFKIVLFCIPKILKNESNSQLEKKVCMVQ